jgi:hypothetical protein
VEARSAKSAGINANSMQIASLLDICIATRGVI